MIDMEDSNSKLGEVYLFSSRQCIENDNETRWLIGKKTEMQESKVLSISVDEVNQVIEVVKSAYKKAKEAGEKDNDAFLDGFLSRYIEQGKEERLVLEEVCRRVVFTHCTGRPSTEQERMKLTNEITTNLSLFKAIDFFQQTTFFKKVYKLSCDNLHVYALKELSGEDYKKVRGKSSEAGANDLWCDLLINYLISAQKSCTGIHLFLHDQDIPGFSSDSLTHIEGVDRCKELGLISDDLARTLGKRSLTITFFMHDNPLINNLIGENSKVDELDSKMTSFFEQVGKIARLRKAAKDRFDRLYNN